MNILTKEEFINVLLGEEGYIDSNNIYHLKETDIVRLEQWIDEKIKEARSKEEISLMMGIIEKYFGEEKRRQFTRLIGLESK